MRPRPSALPPARIHRLGRPVAVLAAAAVAAGVVTGCGSNDAGGAGSGSGVKVVATTSLMGDLVRAIGGDAVDVHQVLQPSTDPHEYEPRPADVAATAQAKVVLASGLGLDEWIGDVVEQSGAQAPVVEVGETVPTTLAGDGDHDHARHDHAEEESGTHADGAAGHEDEAARAEEAGAAGDDATHEGEAAEQGHDQEGDTDPHWWHDPRNVEHAVGTIRDALVRADPDAEPAVAKRAAAYLAKVRALDTAIEACVGAVPKAERKLVTSHDAFGYFAHRYGITVVGAAIPSQTTRAQPSAGEIAALTRIVRAQGVKAIFPESSVNPKLSQAIAKETGARADLTLYGDTLGAAGSDGATYLTMERHNANAVVEGFTGKAGACG